MRVFLSLVGLALGITVLGELLTGSSDLQPSRTTAQAVTPTPPPMADESIRRFLIDSDLTNLPDVIGHDMIIPLQDVSQWFGQETQPAKRALVVSRQFVDDVVAPPGGFGTPGGNEEFNIIAYILVTGHLLVTVDTSSEYLAQQIALAGVTPPFDPYGRPMPTSPVGSRSLAATMVSFTIEHGWFEYALFTQKSRTARSGWIVQDTSPPYDMIDSEIMSLLDEPVGNAGGSCLPVSVHPVATLLCNLSVS